MFFFFFNDTATTEIYTLSLHDALPICMEGWEEMCRKYSYIGMPNHGYSVQVLSKMFRIARKYNTRVHGMALTVTNILQKIPFYSADSTTWLVGQQFGECCYFDGRGMKRLERNQWT